MPDPLKTDILIKQLKTIKPRVVVEVGTQFFSCTDERVERWGISTEYLADYCFQIGCEFYTIDIDPEHTQFIVDLTKRRPFPICALTGDGEKILTNLKLWIDFLYLDSGDDPELTFNQFKAAESYLTPQSITMVDDIQDWGREDPNRKEGKGNLLLPYCRNKGYKVEIVKVLGTSMAVIKK